MSETLFLFSILLLLLVLFLFTIYRITSRIRRDREKKKRNEDSQVGFVVDTFHELVSKLKEKEKELETLHKKAEERADVMENYNENILQSVPSGVISLDSNRNITKVNSAAEKILDIKADAAIGETYDKVFGEPLKGFLEKNLIIGRAEMQYTTRSGKNMHIGLAITPLFDAAKKAIGQLMVFSDLSELKSLEAQAELRDRLSSLGEMAAGMAHELRNPMGVIAGYTKLLSKKTDPSTAHVVDAISKEISVMDRIIADFLSFARPTELNISELDPAQIIMGCVENIIGDRKDIKVCLNIEGMPHMQGDEILMRQTFTNLIQNAVEAMPQGGELRFSFSTEADHIEISISDSGHGIPEKIKDKIFMPFYTTKDKGTGLGLAIVHKIVVSHQGDITSESGGYGTTFRVRLPLRMKNI